MNLYYRWPRFWTWIFWLAVAALVALPSASLMTDGAAILWSLYTVALFGAIMLWQR